MSFQKALKFTEFLTNFSIILFPIFFFFSSVYFLVHSFISGFFYLTYIFSILSESSKHFHFSKIEFTHQTVVLEVNWRELSACNTRKKSGTFFIIDILMPFLVLDKLILVVESFLYSAQKVEMVLCNIFLVSDGDMLA